MTTCRDIIARAFRKLKVYAPGEEPSADDLADGLDELQGLYEAWGSGGLFGRLNDTLQSAGYEASPFDRVQISGGTVTLPTSLSEDDEAPPYALSFIEVIDTDAPSVTRYLFENGEWLDVSELAATDEAPLSSRGRAGLVACLAVNLAEEYGAEIGPALLRQAGAFKTALSLKLGSTAQRSGADYF